MISNFKLFPYFNISQNFVQNVQKQKKNFCPELKGYCLLKVVDKGLHSIWKSVVYYSVKNQDVY